MAIVEYEISLSSDFKISTDDTLEVYKGSNKAVRVIVTSDTYVGSTNDLYINFQREVGAILSRRKMTWDTENSQWYYDLEYKETLKVGTLKISVALTELNVDTYLYTSNELDLECLESGAKVISIENEYVENLVGGTTNQYLGKNSDSETDFSFQTIQSDQVDDSSSANKFVTASEKTQITTNATNIATNTDNIATNTRDIATNTGDIATNTGAIEDLVDGTTPAGKATADGDGNIIPDTYLEKTYTSTGGEGGINSNTFFNGLLPKIEKKYTQDEVEISGSITFGSNDIVIKQKNDDEYANLIITKDWAYISSDETAGGYPILTTLDVINNLTSTEIHKPLSAKQGNLIYEELIRQNNEILALQGSLIPQGNWDADTNTPDISGTTATGYYWVVSVSGATDLGGITDWAINDLAVKSDSGWLKFDNSEKVTSVNGEIGDVVLDADDIDDTSTTNKFVTVEQITQIDQVPNNTDAIKEISELNLTYIPDENLTLTEYEDYIELTAVNMTSLSTLGIPYTLKKEYLGKPLTSIAASTSVFIQTSGLNKFVIPASITTLGAGCFKYLRCEEITFPDTIENIGEDLFALNTTIKKINYYCDVNVPKMCFYECTNLEYIKFANTGITAIGRSAFNGCVNLTEVYLPESLLTIGTSSTSSTFANCTSLKEIKIPNNVTSLGGFVFDNCTNLETVILPNSLTILYQYSFQKCSSIKFLTIPETVSTIGSYCFGEPLVSYSYEKITILNETPVDIDSSVFEAVPDSCKVIVKNIDTYKATNWGNPIYNVPQMYQYDDLYGLGGIDRTTETIKNNADNISTLQDWKMDLIMQYYDIDTMLFSQASQKAGYLYQVGQNLYKYNGIATGSIDDYAIFGIAENITYDNTTSGLTAINAQDAIDELVDEKVETLIIIYDTSGETWNTTENKAKLDLYIANPDKYKLMFNTTSLATSGNILPLIRYNFSTSGALSRTFTFQYPIQSSLVLNYTLYYCGCGDELSVTTDEVTLISGTSIRGGTIITNLNTVNKSGFYTCYETATGVPNSDTSWFILHENSNAGTISATQKAVAYDSSNSIIYTRVKMSSTWGDWVKITTAQDTQTYTTTLPTTSGSASDWQAVAGGYELAKTITGLTIYDSIVSVADDDTIWTDNELNATITANTLTFFVSSLPSAEVVLTLTITKSINGGTL